MTPCIYKLAIKKKNIVDRNGRWSNYISKVANGGCAFCWFAILKMRLTSYFKLLIYSRHKIHKIVKRLMFTFL